MCKIYLTALSHKPELTSQPDRDCTFLNEWLLKARQISARHNNALQANKARTSNQASPAPERVSSVLVTAVACPWHSMPCVISEIKAELQNWGLDS